MKVERHHLREDGSAYFVTYIQDTSEELPYSHSRPAVVVCPGGGYAMCSDREAEPVALEFLTKGFNAFVVRYSVWDKASYPNSLVDLSMAIKIIREHAEEWHIKKDQIAVCGFSAGGHLVSSLANLWNDPEVQEKASCTNNENQPNAAILIYPVISLGEFSHAETRNLLLQGHDDEREQLLKKLSGELNVGEQTPPAFIAHTYADNAVPVENSLMFARAMADANRPFEMHIFQEGYHGLSLGNQNSLCDMNAWNQAFSQWIDLCGDWLIHLFGMDGIPPLQAHNWDYSTRAKAILPV